MKYLKMLGLAAIGASALMAFAGSASATTLTEAPENNLGDGATIHAESEGHAVLDSLAGKIECNSTVKATITAPGGGTPTTDVSAGIETLSFTGCTTAAVHVKAAGSLTIVSSGINEATVYSTGASVTVVTFGLHCGFTTNGTKIGTLKGGTPAKLAISATIPRTYGTSGPFCGSSAPWTGTYKVTNPSTLMVD